MPVDEARLNEFLGKAVGDMGAAMSAALVVIGDRLGLYKALASGGQMTPADLAKQTGTAERYCREWLLNQAASGYVSFDTATQAYFMTPEQALALADESSPCFLPGGFQVINAVHKGELKISDAFSSGKGVGWDAHDPILFVGTERFFGPGYRANLVQSWLPALDGMEARLKAGAKVADVGCGHGASTTIMGKAYPKSTFKGFDYHEMSVDRARRNATEAGLQNVTFEVAMSTDYPGDGYDLVTYFDCLHDMGDPVGALVHARKTLKPDGMVMLVEPFAGDTIEENLNPVGRVYSGASTMICCPASLAYNGPALGAQAGEKVLSEVARQAGFTRFRRATQTPFNLVLELRP